MQGILKTFNFSLLILSMVDDDHRPRQVGRVCVMKATVAVS